MVDHHEVQAALSARLDGEESELADEIVDAHVAVCDECRAFWDKSVSISRRLSFVDSDDSMSPPPDLSEIIIAGVEPEWRRRSAGQRTSVALARVMLAIIAVFLVAWAVMIIVASGGLAPLAGEGNVLAPDAQPEQAALMVEAATLRLGIAVGLLFVAWQPGLVAGLLPVVATVWAFLLGFGIRDVVIGVAAREQILLLVLLGLSLLGLAWLWLSARGGDIRRAWQMLTAEPLQ